MKSEKRHVLTNRKDCENIPALEEVLECGDPLGDSPEIEKE